MQDDDLDTARNERDGNGVYVLTAHKAKRQRSKVGENSGSKDPPDQEVLRV